MVNLFVNNTNCVQIMLVLGIVAVLGISSVLFFIPKTKGQMVPLAVGILSLVLLFAVKDASSEYVAGSPSQAWGEQFAAHCLHQIVGDVPGGPIESYRHYSYTVQEPNSLSQEELAILYETNGAR